MRFSDEFLDRLKKLLPASAIVQRFGIKLRKAGGHGEWKFSEDESFTVSDDKGLIHDHGRTGFSGDIITFWMDKTGDDFNKAVEELARIAAIPMPNGANNRRGNGRANGTSSNGHAPPPADEYPPWMDDAGDPGPDAAQGMHQNGDGRVSQKSEQRLTKVFGYTDQDGMLLYEVCKFEWQEDGERRKRFGQRRPAPWGKGDVLWGLDAGRYIRPEWKKNEWFQATDERRKNWKGKIAASKQVDDGVAHTLYRLPQLFEEISCPVDDRRVIFVPEGEKDAETIAEWDLVATCVSGGAKNFKPEHVAWFKDCDVVIPVDNDKAGRRAGHQKAQALRGVARRVRILDFRQYCPMLPDKGDVTDWRDHHGGARHKLLEIVDKLPDWTPEPPDSAFNAVRFADLDRAARELEWLVKGIITRSEVSIWWGPPGCGKSFLITDAGMAVARGGTWFGQRVKQGLVVYQAGEGGLGLKRRLRAYRQYHNIRSDDDLPFVLLPSRINLWESDDDVGKLIEEIKAWGAYYSAPLEMVVIDTMAAASTGANENASEDVGRVLQRCHRIAQETGAHCALVHHTPKGGGSPRGWGGLTGNVESSLEVVRKEGEKETEYREDGSRIQRDRRELWVRKQKDGEDGKCWRFVIKQVTLGSDRDGDPITSCVISQVGDNTSVAPDKSVIPPGYHKFRTPTAVSLLIDLVKAIDREGIYNPPDVVPPSWGGKAVTIAQWRAVHRERLFQGEKPGSDDAKKLDNKVKQAVQRTWMEAGWADAASANIIYKDKEWIWRTPRMVHEVDPPPVPQVAPPPRRPERDDDDRDGVML